MGSLETGFADSDSGPCEILPQTRVVLCQPPQLELRHRLLVWTRWDCHGGYVGEDEA
jgi:hypothetical protein